MAHLRPHTTRHNLAWVAHLFATSLHSAAASATTLRIQAVKPLGMFWVSAALFIGGVAVGVLVSAQWQPSAATASSTRPSSLASTIARLEQEQADLEQQVASLQSQLGSAQGAASIRKANLLQIHKELDRARIASDATPMHGPGVVARLDDSAAPLVPADEDPSNYIIHDYDLRDILNTLWIAGAEAVSLNGERITSTTSLYCVGSTIVCNVTRLSPPYEIHAIGDPNTLEDALHNSPQMAKFSQRAEIYDLAVKVEQRQDVQVRAHKDPMVFKYSNTQP